MSKRPWYEWELDRQFKLIKELTIGLQPSAESEGPDVRKIQARERELRRVQCLQEFSQTLDGAKLAISEEPCACGGNHHAVAIKNGKTTLLCPVEFYMKRCRALLEREGAKKMLSWSEEHPIGLYLKRIDEEQDATYREELVWKEPSRREA